MFPLGDAFHNFMDGMTFAVGFTESPHVGVALTPAILNKDLPNELVATTAGSSGRDGEKETTIRLAFLMQVTGLLAGFGLVLGIHFISDLLYKLKRLHISIPS